MGANFTGLSGFDTGWKYIYTALLRKVGPWDFSRGKALKEAHRRIVQIETGLMFVTAAMRALKNGRTFEVPAFALTCAEAIVEPHGPKYQSLSVEAQNTIYACQYRSLQDDMKCLVHFGLFEDLSRARYRLTDLGAQCYEYLSHDNDPHHDPFDTSSLFLPSFGGGFAGWDHLQMTVHSPPEK